MERTGVALIGLGNRGYVLLDTCLAKYEDVQVVAVCDEYADRREKCCKRVEEEGFTRPFATDDFSEILKMDSVDAIILTTSWDHHIDMACAAMEAHKAVAFEVGGAYSLDDCWRLVRTYEKTKTPCMMLENCCFGRTELMLLNMVRQGVFGEISHCTGGYCHDLRDEVSFGLENRHYRFRNYLTRNCENYPTHELGPIANILDINRGNRMLSLVSVASCARGLHEFIVREKGEEHEHAKLDFRQGDIVTTIIKCARGETITITLDTTLPRPYSRRLELHGTKAFFMEDNNSLFLDGKDNEYRDSWKKRWDSASEYFEKYEHPLWRRYLQEGVRGHHDGFDWLILRSFFDGLKKGAELAPDVYDAASWMCISALSEQSVALGGMPMAIPDFTNGAYLLRKPWNIEV